MIRLICFSFLLSPIVAFGQEYSTYVDSAVQANTRKDFLRAARYYDSAFAVSMAEGSDYYNAACTYSLAGDKIKALRYLKIALERGDTDFDVIYYDKDLNSIRNETGYHEIEKAHKHDSVIYLFDIISDLSKHKRLSYFNKRISLDHDLLEYYTLEDIAARLNSSIRLAPGDSLMEFTSKHLEFNNCKFENPSKSGNTLANLALEMISFFDCSGHLNIQNIDVRHFFILSENNFKEVSINKLKQHGALRIYSGGGQFTCSNSTFNIEVPKGGVPAFSSNRYISLEKAGLRVILNFGEIEISDAVFTTENKNDSMPFEFALNSERLRMIRNRFDYTVRWYGSTTDQLTVKWNQFPALLDMLSFKLPEANCYIPFKQFENTQFVRVDLADESSYSVVGDRLQHYSDESLVDMLTSCYKALYDNYRKRADLVSSNSSYIRLKELEVDYLKMKNDKNLEEVIRLRLNQMMGLYTDHATSPGKAILISFYIILVFGIFYFLFPSEWDQSTKIQLISDFRIFIEKNEHGYFRPFLKMSKGFLLSYLNAVTLSMNAFITLGFGNIPTAGVARYVCVLQGVLGWFLLSLFTVALLNQVLL